MAGEVLSFSEAKKLLSDKHACLKLVTATKHVALLPKFIGNFTSGIKQVLNTEIKLYSDLLEGVLLSYSNVKRAKHATVMEHYPHMHLSIKADFIIFQPEVGTVLRGVINKEGADHIGVLVHNCFNGSVTRESVPAEKIVIGESITFMVTKIYTNNRIMCFNGTLTEQSENELAGTSAKRGADEAFDGDTSMEESRPKKKKKKKKDKKEGKS